MFSPAYSFNIFFRSIAQYTPADADVINEGEFEKHELHVIAHWRCASNIFLHILSFFLSFLLLNFLQDQPLFFLVNATLSVTSLHTYTEGNEDGFTDGNEDGNKDGFTDGNEDGNKDGFTDGNEDGNKDGITDGNEDGFTDGNEDGNKDGFTDGNEDGITDGNEVGHELHVIAHWRCASNVYLHIFYFFIFFYT